MWGLRRKTKTPPLPFNCSGNWETKLNSESLVSIIQTERERRRKDTKEERIKRGGKKKKAALIIPLAYISASVITVKCLCSSSSSQHPEAVFQRTDNYCYGNRLVSCGEEEHRDEEDGKGETFIHFLHERRRREWNVYDRLLKVDLSDDVRGFQCLQICDRFHAKFSMTWLWKGFQKQYSECCNSC